MFYRFDLKGCLDGYVSSDGKKHKPAKQSVKKNESEIEFLTFLFPSLSVREHYS